MEPVSVWDVDSGGSDSHSSNEETNESIMSGDSDSGHDCDVLELPLKRRCANWDPVGGRADPNAME